MFGEEFRELEKSLAHAQSMDLIIRGSATASRETQMVTLSAEQTWTNLVPRPLSEKSRC